MTLKLRILRSFTRLFIILVSLTRSLFSEKMLISNRCISGLMSFLIKKSWTVSISHFLTSTLVGNDYSKYIPYSTTTYIFDYFSLGVDLVCGTAQERVNCEPSQRGMYGELVKKKNIKR